MEALNEHEANQIKEAIREDQGEDQEKSLLTFSDGTQINLNDCPKDKKGRPIVPDQIMDDFYKELPDGTRSEDGRMVYNGGILTGFDMLPEDRKREIQVMGANALNAARAQRQTFADTIDAMLRSKASAEDIAELGLSEGATKQQALVAAMYREAIQKGTVRAADFIRDTVGEKPADRQEIDANIMTDADKALLERVAQRLGEA